MIDTSVAHAPGERSPGFFARRIFSFPMFLAALVVGAAFLVSSASDLPLGKIFAEGDTWWHLAVGERILATRTFPTTEPYSFTANGTPWIAYGWLPEVLEGLAARMDGLPGLSALLLIQAAIFLLLLYYYAWLRAGDWKAAAVTVTALLPILGAFVTLRPQLLGYISFVLMFICLEHFRTGHRNALWWLAPIFIVWVNSHGTFVIGFAVLVLFWVGGLFPIRHPWIIFHNWTPVQRHRLAAGFVVCLVASCITPYGTKLLSYPLEFALLQGQIVKAVVEWQPLKMDAAYGQALILLVLLVLAAQVVRPAKYRVEELALFIGSAWYACLHERFLIVFALSAVPMVALVCAQFVPRYEPAKDKPVLNAVLIVALVATMGFAFPKRQALESAIPSIFPQQALQYLQAHPPGHLWNEEIWGSYLIWASAGHPLKVLIDGRFDVYEYTGVFADYISTITIRPNTNFVLHKYDIDTVLIHRDEPLATYLKASGAWEVAYEDKLAVVLRRRVPAYVETSR